MTTYLKFKCVFCGQSMEYDPKHAGRQIKCPACNHKIAIPGGKIGGINKQTKDQTWTSDIPSPDVSTPTRYKASPREKSKPSEE